MKHKLIAAIFFLCMLANSASAELWRCADGVFRSARDPEKNCVEVKSGVQCLDGKRLIGVKGDTSRTKCPVAPRVEYVGSRSRPGVLDTSSYGKVEAGRTFDDFPADESGGYRNSRSSRPVYDSIMRDSLENSKIDWTSAIEDVEAGRDPFPDM